MSRYRLIKGILGGYDVYDSDGKQVGYSLPGIIGEGEDFYDMEGNPVGQSFGIGYGEEAFSGSDASGFLDEEILMGRNAWLNGDPFSKKEEPEMPEIPGVGSEMPGFDDPFGSDAGDDLFPDSGWDDGGF